MDLPATPSALAREVIESLALPPESRVEQRVPKKLFLEHGAPTAADRKRIQARIDEVMWVAALKPGTIAIPAHRSDEREYLEIAVLWLRTRGDAGGDEDARLPELVHRAIPYPLLLLSEGAATVSITLVHKRWSLGDASRVVLDGAVEPATLHLPPAALERDFVSSLGSAITGAHDLWALYDGWLARAQALAAARVTGRFVVLGDAEWRQARREAMARYAEARQELEALRLAAGRERQLNKRVELNLTIQRLEREMAGLLERL